VTRHAPSTLAQLGKLKELKLRGGRRVKFPRRARLAADGRGKLYITGARFQKVRGVRNPDEVAVVDEIVEVVYETTKEHLDGVPVEYVHKFGEEGGVPPVLEIDSEGFPLIEGGSYQIGSPGIID
jgi:hypothetical protein